MVFPLIEVVVAAVAGFPLTDEVLGLNLDHPANSEGYKSTTFCGNTGFRTVNRKPAPGLDYLKPEATEPPPNGQLK